MPVIPPYTIYTKTAKGILWSKTVQLPGALGTVFLAVDGRANVADLISRLGLNTIELRDALDKLVADGYIKIVAHQMQHQGAPPPLDGDLDFTAPQEPVVDVPLEGRNAAEEQRASNEAAQQDVDTAQRVRELNARVQAERRAREELARRDAHDGDAPGAHDGWPALQLNGAAPAVSPQHDASRPAETSSDSSTSDTGVAHTGIPHTAIGPSENRNDDPLSADIDPAHQVQTPEHVPTALERAMAQLVARRQAQAAAAEVDGGSPRDAAQPEPAQAPPNEPPSQPETPTIADDEPLTERVNVERAAYDIIAESAEARRKAEVEQLSRDAGDARRRRLEEEGRRNAIAAREIRRKQLLRLLAVAIVGIPAAAVAWLQFARLDGYIPTLQQALSRSLGQPVTISTLRYVLLPTPRLVLENVGIGKAQELRAERVEARVSPLALMARETRFERAEAFGAQIDAAIVRSLPRWGGRQDSGTVHVERLRLTGAKLNAGGTPFGPFDGEVAFGEDGTLQQAVLTSEKTKLEITPRAEGVRVAVEASDWRVPHGPPVEFSHLVVNGLIDSAQVAAAEFTGRAAGGAVEGAFTARWAGPISMQGEFTVQNARVQDLTSELTPQFSARGTLKASGRFNMQAARWDALRTNPQIEASFSIARGELTNIDLVRAIQSPSTSAIRGNRTTFDELSGVLQVSNRQYVYRQLQMTSGPLNAAGAITVTPGGQLSGRLTAELAARGGVVARSMLTIGGTVQEPQLKR